VATALAYVQCMKSIDPIRDPYDDHLFAAAGVTPRIALEIGDLATIEGLVGAGLGVAVVPENFAGATGTAGIALAAPGAERVVGLTWRTDRPLGPAAGRWWRRRRRTAEPHPVEVRLFAPHAPVADNAVAAAAGWTGEGVMRPACVEYLAAASVDEVLDALSDGTTEVLAGGQSLILEMSARDEPPRRVVDINGMDGLDTLSEDDGMLRVGPLVRHRAFESATVGGPLGDLMRLVVCNIGHPPIRALGTMLGSLAHANPAAEWPAVAVTARAELTLTGPDGSRTVPAEGFFTGPFSTVRRPQEFLSEVRFPVMPGGTGTGYAEDRRVTVYPQAATMAAVTVTEGVVRAAAIGLVNAGPCPVRAHAAENVLLGETLSDAAIGAAAEAAAQIDAADNPRRARKTFHLLTRRALTQARERC
jgi:carbon-monoxide dehydrogenase medium subunit